jgi:hypothetical protein
MRTVFLLILSNAFMTAAWYGHLRFKSAPLWLAITASWMIALPEYAVQVPANRFGYGPFTAAQLKIIQEAILFGSIVALAAESSPAGHPLTVESKHDQSVCFPRQPHAEQRWRPRKKPSSRPRICAASSTSNS